MLDDRESRARALDPAHSFIVQAPAGSGKTELLTQRFLRLLATVQQPEEILAITFTRKAAAEMRKRIADALLAAREPPPASAHKRITWDLARAVLQVDEHLGWRLIEQPARLRIQTIDALNALLSRRLPIVAGIGSPLDPADDVRPMHEEAGARLVERLGDGTSESRAIERLISHLGNRVDRLVELIADLLAKRDQWLHQIMHARGTGQLRHTLEQTLAGVIDRHLEDLRSTLGDEQRKLIWELTRFAAQNLLGDPALAEERRGLLSACSSADAVLDPTHTCINAWRVVADIFLTGEGELYRQVTVKQGFPKEAAEVKRRMMQLLSDLREDEDLCAQISALRHLPDPVYSDRQWEVLQALLTVLPLAAAELQIVFQMRGQADYVEAALRALQALGTEEQPTDLALAFDYRLRHVLVDEFQDTSFAQRDLLLRLTAGWVPGDGRTLFCVGDPMQSIYRFRQADVGLFLQVQAEGLSHLQLEPLRLTANFRALPAIVEWVNATFPRVLSNRNDAEAGAVAYSPSTAALPQSQGGVSVHASLDTDDELDAQRVCELVNSILDRDPTGTIAILVNARNHVATIAAELARRRIEFQAVEIELLMERPVVQDLIALTRALVHVGDRTAWLAILRAPWCGLTLPDLHSVIAPIDKQVRVTVLDALRTLVASEATSLTPSGFARLQKLMSIVGTALEQRGRMSLRDWVERTWTALGGPATLSREQDLDDAEAYLERLETLEIAGDLADVAALESQLDRLFARPRSERGRVELMTIHKAKGLEFDYVIVPSLHRFPRNDERELLRWTRIAGARGGIVFAPIKAEGADPDPLYQWLTLLERERSMRERARLLYVAVTRAKRELHLFGMVETTDGDSGPELREPHAGSFLSLLWHAVRPTYESALGGRAVQPQAANDTSSIKLRRLPQTWARPRLDDPLSTANVSVPRMIGNPPEFDWVSETGRHVGTLVHRELDRIVRSEHEWIAHRERLQAEIAELGVPEERRESAIERVIAAVENTLQDERGRWLLGLTGAISEAESELALTGFVRGHLVDGVIDRTFRDATGVRWIVDFKTSTHEGAGLDHFLAEEAIRYRDQLTRYAALMRAYKPGEQVRAALYFPLLKAWREVEVAPSVIVKNQMDLFG